MRLTFVEASAFTNRITRLGLEESIRTLQAILLVAPDAGALDAGTGGLRKIRIADPRRGKGKRGGARVHYLWLPHARRIYLLFVYTKDEAVTLGREQKQALSTMSRAIKAAAGEEE
jgi:hypothetical protein